MSTGPALIRRRDVSLQVCQISYARIQGKVAMVQHFQNSSLLQEDKRCRPVLFHSSGPNAGEAEVSLRPGRPPPCTGPALAGCALLRLCGYWY